MTSWLPLPSHRRTLAAVAVLLSSATVPLGAQSWTDWTASTLSSGTTNGSAGTMVKIETSLPLSRPDGLRTAVPKRCFRPRARDA